MKNLFAYGSLRDPDIISVLLGRSLVYRKAVLPGYARHPVRNTCYPGIHPQAGTATSGIMYRDLQDDDWPVLDWFEERLYQRQSVTIQLDNGDDAQAEAFVIPPDNLSALDLTGTWSFNDFMKHHHEEYLTMCRDARGHYLHHKSQSHLKGMIQ